MSIIASGTTTTTALVQTGNTDGTLQLQVNGTTPSVTLNALGAVGVGSSPSYGTSGQVLTSTGSTSAPSWATPTGAGSGGATASGNVTLTSASSGAQSITTTTWGQYVKLPDATTMTKAACVFNITNAGDYPLKIQNSAGTTKGFIRPKQSATVGLADNSTAAGTWVLTGVTFVDVIGNYSYATTITESVAVLTKLDSDRDLVLYGNSGTYGIIYNRTTQTWGSPTLIRTSQSSSKVAAIKTATDQVLVASATTTAFQAVVLTISGTTITVGTAATATLSSSVGRLCNGQQDNNQLSFVTVGSSYVLSYTVSTGTVPQIRAMTISGTTVTIGSAATPTGLTYQAQMFAVSSSVMLAITCTTGTGQVIATPYTVSGTTLTTGTSATMTVVGNVPYVAALGSRWAIVTTDSSGFFVGAIVSVSGTTATISSAALNAVGMQGSGSMSCAVVGSKVVATSIGSADATKAVVVSFSDNAGTISYSTGLTITAANNFALACILPLTSTTAALHLRVSGAKVMQFTVDTSSASPTASMTNIASGVLNGAESRQISPYNLSNLPAVLLLGTNATPDPTSEQVFNGEFPFFQSWGASGLQNQPTLNVSMSGYTAVSTDGTYMFAASCYLTTRMIMWFIEAAQ